jgi:hypothetical protein
MGIVRFHGKALRLNGLTDGLVVPTGKFREAGFDLRPKEFAASIKSTKSHATKTGRMHIESPSNPLNAIRGAFTIDAYVIPDYGGVIVEKPGSFRLKYGEPFSNGKMIFEVHTADRPYTLSTAFDVSVKTSNNSGVYSSSSNAHRPQDITTGQQGLVLVTAQYTQDELKCYINGDLVADLNLGGEGKILQQSSSDIFIGGRGGETLLPSSLLSKRKTRLAYGNLMTNMMFPKCISLTMHDQELHIKEEMALPLTMVCLMFQWLESVMISTPLTSRLEIIQQILEAQQTGTRLLRN